MFTHRQISMQILLVHPRNGRKKLRAVVHKPSMVLIWTSRTPSPSSSRAHFSGRDTPCGGPAGCDCSLAIHPCNTWFASSCTHARAFATSCHRYGGARASDMSTLPAHRPDDGRPIIVIRAVASPLVGSAPRRIKRIAVFVAFFPPRSETSHRFRSLHPATPWLNSSYAWAWILLRHRCTHWRESASSSAKTVAGSPLQIPRTNNTTRRGSRLLPAKRVPV